MAWKNLDADLAEVFGELSAGGLDMSELFRDEDSWQRGTNGYAIHANAKNAARGDWKVWWSKAVGQRGYASSRANETKRLRREAGLYPLIRRFGVNEVRKGYIPCNDVCPICSCPCRRIGKARLCISTTCGFIFSFFDKGGRLWEAFDLLMRGYSIRETTRLTGSARNTVRKVSNALTMHGIPAICQCGRSSKHQGWCRFRISRSRNRQDYLALFTAS